MTIGIHARVIPGRIHDIPVTAQARLRFPHPRVESKERSEGNRLGDLRRIAAFNLGNQRIGRRYFFLRPGSRLSVNGP